MKIAVSIKSRRMKPSYDTQSNFNNIYATHILGKHFFYLSEIDKRMNLLALSKEQKFGLQKTEK